MNAYGDGYYDGYTSELPNSPLLGHDDYIRGYVAGSIDRDDDRKVAA